MRICSFDLSCAEYEIDFEDANKHELYKLYKDKKSVSSYFSIPGSTQNVLKIYLPIGDYSAKVAAVRRDFVLKFALVVFVIIVLSLFFAFYTLSPLRNALNLTQEFIKDILHDFNTPLATLRLNVSMLEAEQGESKKLQRIKNSVQTVLSLQSNLRAYLHNHSSQVEEFALDTLVKERVQLIEENFAHIKYDFELKEHSLKTNKEALTRILDNLISNASKYNKRDGNVRFIFKGTVLEIEDSGKGIQNPDKIFKRFYKEQERGIGIGLHIVQKLCEEINVSISVKSEVGVGTSFFLDLKSVITC